MLGEGAPREGECSSYRPKLGLGSGGEMLSHPSSEGESEGQ